MGMTARSERERRERVIVGVLTAFPAGFIGVLIMGAIDGPGGVALAVAVGVIFGVVGGLVLRSRGWRR
jgi:membrane associated rhomboid family serine protease